MDDGFSFVEFNGEFLALASLDGKAQKADLDFSLCQTGQIRSLLDGYLGGVSNWEVADPIAYASPDIPISVLCLHGAKDPLVDPENSRSFVNKLNKGSIHRAELQIFPNRYHSDMLNMFLEMSAETKILTDWLANVDKV